MYKKLGMAALGAAAAYSASGRGRRSDGAFDTRRKAFPKKTHLFKDPSTSRVARVLRSGGFDAVTDDDYFVVVPGEQRGGRFVESGSSVRTGDPHRAQKLAVAWVYQGTYPTVFTLTRGGLCRNPDCCPGEDEWDDEWDDDPYAGGLNRGRRAAPTTKQRRKMGQKLMALPWRGASETYKKAHPEYKGIGGYPMDTLARASGARAYAISSYNAEKLTKGDVDTIFRRTSRKYPSLPKYDGIVCRKIRYRGMRRKCKSVTSR